MDAAATTSTGTAHYDVGVKDVQYLLEEQKQGLLRSFQQMHSKAMEEHMNKILEEALPKHLETLNKDLAKSVTALQVEVVKGSTKVMEAKTAVSTLEKTMLQNFNTVEKKIDAVYAKLSETERKVMGVRDAQQEIKDGQVEVRKEVAVQQQKQASELANWISPLAATASQIGATVQPVAGALQSIKAVLESLPDYAFTKRNFDELAIKVDDTQEHMLVKLLDVDKICNDIGTIMVRFEKEQAAACRDIADKIGSNNSLPYKDPPGRSRAAGSTGANAAGASSTTIGGGQALDLAQALGTVLTSPAVQQPASSSAAIRPIQLANHVPPAGVPPANSALVAQQAELLKSLLGMISSAQNQGSPGQ